MSRSASREKPTRRRGGAKPSAAPSAAPPRDRSRSRQRGGEVHTGSICRYEDVKGYGFIASDTGGEDVFFPRAELPREMAGATRRDELEGARVEFEMGLNPEGKLRARAIVLLQHAAGFRGGAPPESRQYPDGTRLVYGRILRYDRQKGYGFIQAPGETKDIFFLPSTLPPELRERCERGQNVEHMEVEVDVHPGEEGKPRATRVAPREARPPPPQPRQRGGPPAHFGTFLRYDPSKGFGFLKPEDLDEDIFCLRSELPAEIREEGKDAVIGRRVEFELKTMPDGKMRAQHCRLAPPPGRGGPPRGPPPGPPGGGGPGAHIGRVRRFDRQKGYGFIETPSGADVFFLPSALPQDLRSSGDNFEGMEVTFNMFMNEEGKPRAKDMTPIGRGGPGLLLPPPPPFMGMPPMGMGPMGMGPPMWGPPVPMWGPPPMGGPMGVPLPPPPGAPIMPLPQQKQGARRRERRERKHAPPTGGEAPEDDGGEELPPIDDAVLDDMVDFLVQEHGSCDFGKFTSRFQRIKKRQCTDYFSIIEVASGRERIELPEDHPARDRIEPPGSQDEAMPGQEEDGIAAEEDGDLEGPPSEGPGPDDPPPDEPAIMASEGCQPLGKIHSYDPGRGWGFVRVEGFQDDIYFQRSALPTLFHGKSRKDMPELVGVTVGVVLSEGNDRGPKASRLHLQLRYHTTDRCWLLNRK